MKINVKRVFFFIILLILLTSCNVKKPIGGDKDEHGCLPAAGYQWCPSTEKCQRMWEEYCEEFKDQYKGEEKTFCTEEQRKAEACIEIYQPVCGWIIKEIICIKYPCAQTFSNSCVACKDSNVAYWTEGECPE